MRADSTYLSYFPKLLSSAAAYKAKLLCSGLFGCQREASSLLSEDLAVDSLAPLRGIKTIVDREQQTVTASCLGKFRRTALYRPGLGSTLVLGTSVEALRQQGKEFAAWAGDRPRPSRPLPVAHRLPPAINRQQLSQAVDSAFTETNPAKLKRTRAVVVVYRGKIVAERYADGFSAQTPMLGWSVAKSAVNALVGVLVQQGKLTLDARNLLPEWQNDARRDITLDMLLRMSSGLAFSERYGDPLSDVMALLFQRGDGAQYAAQLPLATSPGKAFHYASGTTVLLCRIVRAALGGTLTDYFSFPRQALFDRLGMASAVLEPDAAGTFTGSSFMYATARDWAKLGLLYLQDGVWAIAGRRERILPEGWVNYSVQPSETAPFYGAHFWRGVPLSFAAEGSDPPVWPADAYLGAGYQGQFVTVIPSRDLVVVRLGLSQRRNSWDHPKFINDVVRAIA